MPDILLTIDVESEKKVEDGVLHHLDYLNDIQKPVTRLLQLSRKYSLRYVFFLPFGEIYPDFPQVVALARQMLDGGHQLGLHLHLPFNRMPVEDIVQRLREEIALFQQHLAYRPTCARAGGFNVGRDYRWLQALSQCRIPYDSSVLPRADIFTTAHWSDVALPTEEKRWGKDAYYFDFREAPLAGSYTASARNINTPNRTDDKDTSGVIEFPITSLVGDPRHIRPFDLQFSNQTHFQQLLDDYSRLQETTRQPVILVSLAHTLKNYTANRDAPTIHMINLEKRLRHLGQLVKEKKATSLLFDHMTAPASTAYQNEKGYNHYPLVYANHLRALYMKKILRDIQPGKPVLLLRSAPFPVIADFIKLVKQYAPHVDLHLLAQQNAVTDFTPILDTHKIIPLEADWFTRPLLKEKLSALKNNYSTYLFIYNNDNLEGYSNIESSLAFSRVKAFGIKKDFSQRIPVGPSFLFKKHILKGPQKWFAPNTLYRLLLSVYFSIQFLVKLPVNLLLSLFSKDSTLRDYAMFPHISPQNISNDFKENLSTHMADPRFQEPLLKKAQRILDGKIHILGYPDLIYRRGTNYDWHTDLVSGKTWPMLPGSKIKYASEQEHADIKIPWELSRFHHLLTLTRAMLFYKDKKQDSTFTIYYKEITSQLDHWIRSNPYRRGVNWNCAMEVGIRALNWLLILSLAHPYMDNDRLCRYHRQLIKHGRFIYTHLEYSIKGRGNHYMANIVALLVLGIYFSKRREGRKWLAFALPEFIHEIDYQFDHQGASDEGATAYHMMQLELVQLGLKVLTDTRLSTQFVPGWVIKKLDKIRDFGNNIRYQTFVPQIGDNDSGRILGWENDREKETYFNFPSSPISIPEREKQSAAYDEAGFFMMRDSETFLQLRCGKNGYRGLGFHDHCDRLSFQLYAHGRPLIVDPGSYVYTANYEKRNFFRGTASHNTLQIRNWEQNAFNKLDLFLMKDRAHAACLQWQSTPEYDFFIGKHSGFSHYLPGLEHVRRVLFHKNPSLKGHVIYIYDSLQYSGSQKLSSDDPIYNRLHLAPGLTCQKGEANLSISHFDYIDKEILQQLGWEGNPDSLYFNRLKIKDTRTEYLYHYLSTPNVTAEILPAQVSETYGSLTDTTKIQLTHPGLFHFLYIITIPQNSPHASGGPPGAPMRRAPGGGAPWTP